MNGYRTEKRKTPRRFFWRLCLQSAGAFGVFLMVLWLFHTTVPGAELWQLAVRQWFTTDADLTPIIAWFDDTDTVQASTSLLGKQVQEAVVIPVSGTVVPQSDKEMYLYVQTDGTEAILAAYAGTVTDIFTDEMQQTVICISHANGFVTTYGGCTECCVALAEPVKKGQVIGRTATNAKQENGMPGQANFYFAASYLGTEINPLELLQSKEIIQLETAL